MSKYFQIPVVLLSVFRVICHVVGEVGLRCTDVSFTSSLKKKDQLHHHTFTVYTLLEHEDCVVPSSGSANPSAPVQLLRLAAAALGW